MKSLQELKPSLRWNITTAHLLYVGQFCRLQYSRLPKLMVILTWSWTAVEFWRHSTVSDRVVGFAVPP